MIRCRRVSSRLQALQQGEVAVLLQRLRRSRAEGGEAARLLELVGRRGLWVGLFGHGRPWDGGLGESWRKGRQKLRAVPCQRCLSQHM